MMVWMIVSGILNVVREEQPEKAAYPIVDTEGGTVIEVMDQHPSNMYDGMDVIVSGRSIDKREENSSKHPSPREVIVFGRSIGIIDQSIHPTTTRSRQPQKAPTPTEMIVFGMMTVSKKSKSWFQLLNATPSIEVNLSGILQVVRPRARRIASALVKAVMLEEEEREENGVSNESTKYQTAIYQGTEDDNTRRRIGL